MIFYVVTWMTEAISKTNVYVSANRHPRHNTYLKYILLKNLRQAFK